MKKLIAAFVFLTLITVLIAACGGPGSVSSGGSNEVHMGATNFVQSSITIKKGSSVTLVNDTGTVHIIENGTWSNNTPMPNREHGAPTVHQTFSGNDIYTVGPFNTAGTYQLYCTVHPNMNLRVIVQ